MRRKIMATGGNVKTQYYFKELSLEEGFTISNTPKKQRLVGGRECGSASGLSLFNALHNVGQPIKCWLCGCAADRWILTLGKNDTGKPVLNLFATRVFPPTKKRKYPLPVLVMMTRDHIIPKSLGGRDIVENLRAGCELCNSERGSEMNDEELEFMRLNPHLICPERAARGVLTRERLERELQDRLEWREKQGKGIENGTTC